MPYIFIYHLIIKGERMVLRSERRFPPAQLLPDWCAFTSYHRRDVTLVVYQSKYIPLLLINSNIINTFNNHELQLQNHKSDPPCLPTNQHRPVQNPKENPHRRPPRLCHFQNQILLHEEGQILPVNHQRKINQHPRKLPQSLRYPPLLRRPL